jgi:allophanate hydrolase subunit 2
VLGARSTYLPGEFGGLAGRALRSGDVVAAQPAGDLARRVGRIWPAPPDYAPRVRVLPFDGPVPDALIAHEWRVGAQSNRIGLRLSGPRIEIDQPRVRDSFGVFPSVIQLPPDGQPILLTADAQPTGGYPVIAIAIQADLHRVAQVLPGDALRFVPTTLEEAVDAWRRLQALLALPVEEDEGMALAARARG